MIEFAIISALLLILLYIVVKTSTDERDRMRQEFAEERDRMRQEFAEERQILLNRIENPKYRPPITAGEKQANLDEIRRLREETEAFGLVGKIVD